MPNALIYLKNCISHVTKHDYRILRVFYILNAFNNFQSYKPQTFVLTKPFNQIFISYIAFKCYTISTGVIVQHLKVATRAIRRSVRGWRLLIIFIQKRAELLNSFSKAKNTNFKINTLQCYNKLKPLITPLWLQLSVGKVRIFINNTYNSDNKQHKKYTYIKRYLRQRLTIK